MMPKDTLIYLLVFFDLLILVFLVLLYYRFKKLLNFPWEELEASIERAQELVEKLREIKREGPKGEISSKEQNHLLQVVDLYKKGLNPKEIAKNLGLSTGEVEIILKRKGLL